ncbi:PAS domain-containing protein, partial [Candidatus Saccharibacteria bacterium]|nr:PAS domain-containing protein [Candidatus Saccharibacteria bacterium]
MPELQKTNDTTAELEHERLRSLINSMGDGVIATDESAKILFYNGAALNILDLNSEIKNKSLGTVVRLVDKNNQPVDIK